MASCYVFKFLNNGYILEFLLPYIFLLHIKLFYYFYNCTVHFLKFNFICFICQKSKIFRKAYTFIIKYVLLLYQRNVKLFYISKSNHSMKCNYTVINIFLKNFITKKLIAGIRTKIMSTYAKWTSITRLN